MPREKMDIFGTPPEDWIRMHTVQPKPTPSLEEYLARENKITPDQLELFDKIAEIVGNPRFALKPFVTIPMKTGLWRSVERGEITHVHGLMLDKIELEALESSEGVQSEQEAGFTHSPESAESSFRLELFDSVSRLVGDPRFAFTSFVNVMMMGAGKLFAKENYLNPIQVEELNRLYYKALNRGLEEMEKGAKERPKQSPSDKDKY